MDVITHSKQYLLLQKELNKIVVMSRTGDVLEEKLPRNFEDVVSEEGLKNIVAFRKSA